MGPMGIDGNAFDGVCFTSYDCITHGLELGTYKKRLDAALSHIEAMQKLVFHCSANRYYGLTDLAPCKRSARCKQDVHGYLR